MDEEVLLGGVANAGAVTRVGNHVLRPADANSESIHRFLSALRATGFDGASEPVGIDPDGRERLIFIEGHVAVPPYPVWAERQGADLHRPPDEAVPRRVASLRFSDARLE